MPIRVVTKEVRYIHVLSLTLEHSMPTRSPAALGLTVRDEDHVVDAEVLGGEAAHELGEVEGRWREEVERAGGDRDVPVEAAGGHVEVNPAAATKEGGRVARR